MTATLARTVAYDAVKQSVAAELKEFVKREAFVEMFEYVINMGANNAPFIPALVDFTSVWVNSELTKLPLAAFKEANKLSNDFPRTKLAVIYRAYMMTPNSQGYVPVPESSWARVTKPTLSKLEELLKYWDVQVRQSIASMEPTMAQYVNASAATNAAAAFIKFAPIPADGKKGGNLDLEMLKATLDEYNKISKHLQDQQPPLLPPPPPAGAEWIDYAGAQKHVKEDDEKAKKEAEKRPADKNVPLLAKCIEYDKDGKPLDEQDSKVKTGTGPSMVEIPWSSWLVSATGRDMDLEKSLTSAIHTVLHSLHTSVSLVHAPIQFLLNETTKRITAFATRDIAVNELQLPPCAPGAGSKLVKEPTKPNGIKIEIEESHLDMTADRRTRMRGKTTEGANTSTAPTTHSYYVFPDTRLPSWESLLDDNTAVAADRGCRRAIKPMDGKEVMHPFWLIPRMTERDLRTRNEDTKGTQVAVATFNVEFDKIQCGVVTAGCLMNKKTNIAWVVNVPILTNGTAIKKGEELILRVAAPPKKDKEPNAETWKDGAKRAATTEGSGGPKKQKRTDNKATGGTDERKPSVLSIRV